MEFRNGVMLQGFLNETVSLELVREELTKEELARALQGDDPFPNAWQVSLL